MKIKLYDDRKRDSEFNFPSLYSVAWGGDDSTNLARLRYSYTAELIGKRFPRTAFPSYRFIELGCGPASFYNVLSNYFVPLDKCIGIEPYPPFASFARRYFPVIRKKFENLSPADNLKLTKFSPMFCVAVGIYNKWVLLAENPDEARELVRSHVRSSLAIAPFLYIVGYGSGAKKLKTDSLSLAPLLSGCSFSEFQLIGREHESVFEVRSC